MKTIDIVFLVLNFSLVLVRIWFGHPNGGEWITSINLVGGLFLAYLIGVEHGRS